MNQDKIGKFIAQLRKEKKMTQEELAWQLYTDRTIVSKWERGLYLPKHDIILKLSQLFDVSVNEIYYGERQNKDNKFQVSEVTIDIIKRNDRKIKKIVLFSSLIILFLTIIFFTYYFINNYKSINVYTITENASDVEINGLLVISNEQMYIQFDGLENIKNIRKISLYYEKNSDKKIIIEDNSKLKLYINKFGKDEDFSHRDFKYLKNNLYIEIIDDDDNIKKIKLELTKSFTNSNIFSKKINDITEEEIINEDESIPEYFKNKFKFNEDEECYYRNEKRDSFDLKEMYYYNAKLYVVEENYTGYILRFEYSFTLEDFHFYKIVEDNEEQSFNYDISKNSCYSRSCDEDKIKYFTDNYLSKFDKK